MVDSVRQGAQRLAPRGWLDDPTSLAYIGAHGDAVSTSLALWQESALARFASTGPDDAVPLICDARQIEQAPGETIAAVRLRLVKPFTIHRQRTTKDAYRNALEPLGVDPDDVVVWNDYEDSVIPAPPGTDPWWSRVIVVVDCSGGPWSSPVWSDDLIWGDEEVWGVEGMTIIQLRWLRRTFRRWKWTGAFPLALVLIFGGSVWGLDTVWSDSDVWSDDPASVAVIQLGKVWGWNEAIYGIPDVWTDDAVWEDPFIFD